MKWTDKAIEAAATSLFGSHDVEKKWVEEALTAASAAQFQSEDYAGLVERLRAAHKSNRIEWEAADALEVLLAERDDWKTGCYFAANERDQAQEYADKVGDENDVLKAEVASWKGRQEATAAEREKIKSIRLELINQWQANHWEHCGNSLDQNLLCSRGEQCHWPLPACLSDITPEEIVAAIRSQK